MSCEWPLVPIREVAEVYDGPHATPKKTSHGPVFLGISNLNRGRIDRSSLEHLSEEDFKKWTHRVTPRTGDVVFSYETRIGEAAIIPPGLRCCLGRRLALVRTNAQILRPRFFLYYFLSPEFQDLLAAKTIHGSTVDRILLTEFPEFPVRVPPLDVQDRIVSILGAIDDRIDLLVASNTTLQALADALFTSWFVNFEPVRAKAEGREPRGVDVHTAALFPNGFDETGRSAVPRGWRRGVLGDILFDSTERVGSRSIPVLSAVNSGELVPSREFFHKRVHSRNTSHYKLVPPFAFAYNPSRINIGSIGLNETGQDGAVSPVYVVCKPVSVPVAYYVWHLLRTPAIREWINVLSSGTVRQNLTYRDFASIRIVIPPDELLERFFLIRSTLYRRVAHNERMIRTLTQLRDELLPRLISSKLRVPEAEEALKEVL